MTKEKRQQEFENERRIKQRRMEYEASPLYRKHHKAAQQRYRKRRYLARRDYWKKVLGDNPDLSELNECQREIVKLHYGVSDSNLEPLGVKAICQHLKLTMSLVRSNLSIAKEKLGLTDTLPT